VRQSPRPFGNSSSARGHLQAAAVRMGEIDATLADMIGGTLDFDAVRSSVVRHCAKPYAHLLTLCDVDRMEAIAPGREHTAMLWILLGDAKT
jgi:hypothetical protein